MNPQNQQEEATEPLRIVITGDKVEIFGYDRPVLKSGHGFTCRTATHEAIAWAVRRLGEELEHSTAFYRTGDWQKDNIEIYEEGPEEWKCPT
ncbi:hypothetical protein HA052_23210 [Chromobacterium haemolyticum]|uniref:DUF2188 domain-containing protein n=1 Tax=Chromobacterium fluminis TaxID=3044269 RepID=A0ABX0L902_9NEIS|nr:hypothetical protein [Chromobacterium haemolyticum]NHR08104.1 hypothetical protein [Chromobacterium haemolyticum]